MSIGRNILTLIFTQVIYISVKVGEPDKLRPSGFGNVANILRNLGRNAGIDR